MRFFVWQVELLRSCELAVGWSGAMSLATAWDHQDSRDSAVP